ncbi:MAG: type II secretion system major pseudopilin GspG [Gammaproteobacteria bacterium]
MRYRPQPARVGRGFSLIELLVVIGILAVIAAIVAPNLLGKADDANVNATKVQIEQLTAAVDLYRLETGKYPERMEDLLEQPADNPRWKGPYVRKKRLLQDPWHNDIQYQRPGEHGPYDLYSFGADGQPDGEGNDADIGNWD